MRMRGNPPEIIQYREKMTAGRTCRRLLLLVAILKLCCAEKLKCSTLPSGNTTKYIIHEDYVYSGNTDDDCDFTWYDINDTVIANQESKSPSVTSWSINSLTIEGCIPAIFLKRHCISEGEEFTANCRAPCGDHPKLPTDDDTPGNSTYAINPNHVAVPVAVAVLVLIVLVILGIVYVRKKNFFRDGPCGQMGGIYSAGKPVNIN